MSGAFWLKDDFSKGIDAHCTDSVKYMEYFGKLQCIASLDSVIAARRVLTPHPFHTNDSFGCDRDSIERDTAQFLLEPDKYAIYGKAPRYAPLGSKTSRSRMNSVPKPHSPINAVLIARKCLPSQAKR